MKQLFSNTLIQNYVINKYDQNTISMIAMQFWQITFGYINVRIYKQRYLWMLMLQMS